MLLLDKKRAKGLRLSRLALYERALGPMMGRKNQRSADEPLRMPPPNPPLFSAPRPPKPPRSKVSSCSFENCKRVPTIWFLKGQVCEQHADDIWERVEMRDAKERHLNHPGMEGREYIRADARKIKAVERRKPTSFGEIYYVQADGLIKVGWTTKLADRVRAYGPKAVLLANYPGTRADEAALHRQLKPCLYRGREWYTDGPIIRDFIAKAIEQHGPPRFKDTGWTEPKTVVAGKRAGRRWS